VYSFLGGSRACSMRSISPKRGRKNKQEEEKGKLTNTALKKGKDTPIHESGGDSIVLAVNVQGEDGKGGGLPIKRKG